MTWADASPLDEPVPHVHVLGEWVTGEAGEQTVTLVRADEAGTPVLRVEVEIPDREEYRRTVAVDLRAEVAVSTALALLPVLDDHIRQGAATQALTARRLALLEYAGRMLHAALEGDDIPDADPEPF